MRTCRLRLLLRLLKYTEAFPFAVKAQAARKAELHARFTQAVTQTVAKRLQALGALTKGERRAADASGPPEGVRGAWWSTARFILRRSHAEDDVVATRAQAVALPSAAPAGRDTLAGHGPSDSRRSFAAPVFARLDSGCWHAREGRTCLTACPPVQNVGDGEAGGAHREA